MAQRSFNFETEPTVSLRVRVETGTAGEAYEERIELQTLDQNDAPTLVGILGEVSLTLGEHTRVALLEGIFHDEDANDVLTAQVSLADGSALPAFIACDEATGMLTIDAAAAAEAGTYTLRVVASDGKAQAETTFDLVLHKGAETIVVDEVAGDLMNIFPNPTDGIVTLQMREDAWEGMEVRVTTMQGAEVQHFVLTAATAEIDLSKLAAGAYVIAVGNGDTLHRVQVIKQ